MIYLDLFLGFLRVGCFAFGGAYGAIPLIRDITLAYGWLTDDTLAHMIAISESTPGPITVNLATYVGSSQAGLLGAAIATFAVILPSFVIIIFIMTFLKNALKNKYVKVVLNGLKPCITGIILATGAYMTGGRFIAYNAGIAVDTKALALTIVLSAVMFLSKPLFKKKLSPILLIVLSAVLGAIVYA